MFKLFKPTKIPHNFKKVSTNLCINCQHYIAHNKSCNMFPLNYDPIKGHTHFESALNARIDPSKCGEDGLKFNKIEKPGGLGDAIISTLIILLYI